MRTQNKGTRSSRFRITTIAIAVASSFAMTPAWAADTATGSGSGVAYGTGSDAPKAENVAIGPNAKTDSTHSVNTGEAGIAIGANAKTITEVGRKGAAVVFMNPDLPTGNFGAGGIAIGKNSIGYNGSTVLGQHDYTGQIGDVNVNKQEDASNSYENLQYGFGATSVGYNSYTAGQYATSIGAYNVNSANYYPGGTNKVNGNNTVFQGLGATIIGSFNSNESRSSQSAFSGMANSLIGIANRTQNSNGSLIFGAGNEITNSYASISGLPSSTPSSAEDLPSSAEDLANTIRKSVKDSDGGGATLAIGGGNTADYTQASQLIGVNNTLKGTSSSISQYNALNGYKNTAENVTQTYITGLGNTVSNSQSDVVIGDYHTLSGGGNNVVIGSMEAQDLQEEKTVNGVSYTITKVPVKAHQSDISDTVMIGHNADVTVNGGVALGANSVASTDKGVAGYDLSTGAASTETSVAWKSTAAAVSVGDVDHEVTRQITGVAAGLNDTDAVNVAQLKKAAAAATTTVATTDSNLTVAETPSGSHNYQVGLNKDLTGMQSAEFTNATGTEQTRISQAGVVITKKDSTTVSLKATGLDNGGQTITNVYAGSNDTDAANVRQLKDSRSMVETAQPTYVQIQTSRENPTTNSGATIYSVGMSPYAQSGIDYSNTYLGPDGIDAKGKKITGVAAGSISASSTDAVNGSQLYLTNQAVQQNSDDISKLYNRSAELNRKIHRAGAHAAALAALHPLDFDENHRVSASLGLGQYHSSGAAALGIFVRPTENFMVSLGGSIASGSDLMGNLGVHYRFGGDSVRVNKTELTQQVSTLTAENRDLSAKLASSNSKLEAATSKIDSLMERIHAIEAKLNMK